MIGSHFALRERAKKPHNVSRITIQCYFLMGFLTLLELVNIPFCHAFLPLLNVTIQKKIEWGMYIQNIPILLLDGWVSYEETAMFQNGVGWCLSKSASNPKLVTLVNLHVGSNRYFCLSYSCILFVTVGYLCPLNVRTENLQIRSKYCTKLDFWTPLTAKYLISVVYTQ